MIFEPGIGVEHARQHKADALRRGLDRKPPGGAQYARMLLGVALVIGLDHRLLRQRRVDVDRHVQRLRPLVDRPEPLVVVKEAAGQAVDHRALEAELGDGALQFVGRGARIGGRQHGEPGEAVGMGAHRRVEAVVDATRQRHAGCGIDRLQSRDRMRQDLQVDAGFVHLLEAQRAQIVEPLDNVAAGAGAAEPLHLGIEVMFFQSDDIGFCRHLRPPLVGSQFKVG